VAASPRSAAREAVSSSRSLADLPTRRIGVRAGLILVAAHALLLCGLAGGCGDAVVAEDVREDAEERPADQDEQVRERAVPVEERSVAQQALGGAGR
jgi:hypothetical protein